MRTFSKVFLVLCVVVVGSVQVAQAKKAKKMSMILRQKETNPINFMRLAVMRLIYGVATRIGFGEQISEALNGAFVPPGAEDYDDFDFDGGDDDFDYR